VLDARDQTGVFLANTEPKYMGELAGHGMNIVGYHDDWLSRNRFRSRQTNALMKGGFILHNSWRAGGHSVAYLYGDESEENEATICLNHVAAIKLVPATYDCVVEAVANGSLAGNVNGTITGTLNCSADIQQIGGRGITKGADLLSCSNRLGCEGNLTYVLERAGGDVNHTLRASGLADVRLITLDGRVNPPAVGRMTVRSLPFWALSQIFGPTKLVPNDPNNCGYWILPYETLENMQRVNWDLLDNFRVVDLEIEFNESSFPTHPNSWDFDTSFLNASKKLSNKTRFDGPSRSI
jgi:hypothetical protein